jgi:hypothetical protein
MDLFTFGKTSTAFNLQSAQMVNGYDSATWTEKFRDASDFVIVGGLDSNLEAQLPIGNLISHVDTEEVMVIENHQIKVGKDKSEVVISGRGFETFLENRIVGSNRAWPATSFPQSQWSLIGNRNDVIARQMIAEHIDWQDLIMDSDSLAYVNTYVDGFISELFKPMFDPVESEFTRDTVYKHVIDLLAIDNLGFTAVRPTGKNYDDGLDQPTRYGADYVTLKIYPGFERTQDVVFSHELGDIEEAEYLRSNKSLKTSCLVVSRWFVVMVHGPEANYSRRTMVLDAKDLDEQYDQVPWPPIDARTKAIMSQRGRAAIQKKRAVAISSIKINQTQQSFKYREHYNLGDLVTVHGEYNSSSVQQVMEHVEIEDENGSVSYPTLTEPFAGGYYVPRQFF